MYATYFLLLLLTANVCVCPSVENIGNFGTKMKDIVAVAQSTDYGVQRFADPLLTLSRSLGVVSPLISIIGIFVDTDPASVVLKEMRHEFSVVRVQLDRIEVQLRHIEHTIASTAVYQTYSDRRTSIPILIRAFKVVGVPFSLHHLFVIAKPLH